MTIQSDSLAAKPALLALAFVMAMATAGHVHAYSFTADLDTPFNEDGTTPKPAPDGTSPWVTATFDDQDSAGSVFLTIDATNLDTSNYIDDFYFNFNSEKAINDLIFTYQSALSSGPNYNNVSVGFNSQKADGHNGQFDILFDFPPPPGTPGARFEGGEVAIFQITGISDLVAQDFEFLTAADATKDNQAFLAAAHIQNISEDPPGSTFIGAVDDTLTPPQEIPEPAPLALMALGILGLGLMRRYQQRS